MIMSILILLILGCRQDVKAKVFLQMKIITRKKQGQGSNKRGGIRGK